MASEGDLESPPSSTGGVQKHRACDECRSRKLACSKEPDGCSRCRREGLRCHYSAQKPMGRPRKRRNLDEGQRDERQRTSPLRQQRKDKQTRRVSHGPVLSPGESILQQILPPVSGPADFSGYAASTVMPLDPTLAFLDDQRHHGGMDFLDMMPQNYATSLPRHDEHAVISTTESMHTPSSFGLDMGGVDLMGGIGFGHQHSSHSAPRSAASRIMHDSFGRYVQKTWDHPDSMPSPSLSDARSSTASSASLRPNPNISCGCLSSLYLTLDCLSNLPADIPAAIRTVRNASRVAHSSISCDLCSGTSLTESPSSPVPIQSFQNLMLLAALVPSACNAYATILERVDQEADRARQDNEELWFSFREIGGVWGAQAEEGKDCFLMQNYNDKKMPPDMWRSAMREVIRSDVDGVDGGSNFEGYKQKGLRDVIKALEERSEKRHASMDHAAAMGQLPKTHLVIQPAYQPVPHEQRHCIRVLDAAKMALENLVIA